MTPIVDVLARCARECSIDEPTSWSTATDDDHLALRDDFFMETIDDILERVDLPAPFSAQEIIAGDGSETYTLPAAFKRLQRDRMAVYETTTNRRMCTPVTDDGMWTHIKELGTAGVERYYKLTGYPGAYSISFYQNPATGVSITVSYATVNWMRSSGGTNGSAFTDAGDTLLLPRRVVEAGTVMRFRERNGLDPSLKMKEYEILLSRLSNDSRTRRTINFGETSDTRAPWDVPVPDFIPEA